MKVEREMFQNEQESLQNEGKEREEILNKNGMRENDFKKEKKRKKKKIRMER